jgi:hypothetical protein
MKHFERSLDATDMSKRPLFTIPWRTLGLGRNLNWKNLSLGRDVLLMRRSD